MEHLLKGILIGFSIAAPVGPIGLLCMRRSLTDGRLVGFVSGLGAAAADTLFGAIATLGLTAILGLLSHYELAFQLIGGALMIGLGIHTYRAPTPDPDVRSPAHAASLRAAFLSTFGLTLANPVTILAFTTILAAIGLDPAEDTRLQSGLLVAGVFVGSTLWWGLLSLGAGWFGRKLSPRTLRCVNHIAGGAIMAFGGWQLLVASRVLIR